MVESFAFVQVPPFCYFATILALGLLGSAAWQKPFQRSVWRPHYWLALTQLLFVPALAVVGALYRVVPDPNRPLARENALADWSINALVLLSLVSCFFWVYRMKGIRCFAFCVLVIQEVFVLGAMFLAGMSISGDWL